MRHVWVTILWCAMAAGTAAAQEEMEAAFDTAGTVRLYTAEMERTLNLFPAQHGLIDARLLQESPDKFVIDIRYLDGDQVAHVRLHRSALEIADLRRAVSRGLARGGAAWEPDHSSRSKFIIWETLLSTFYYGPSLITAFDITSASAGAGVELLIGGAGFLVSTLATEHASMSDAQCSLALGGAFLGAGHTALLDLLFTDGSPGREMAPLMACGSIAETAVGSAIASQPGYTEGKSDIVRYGGFFGMTDGFAMGEIIQPGWNNTLMCSAGLIGSAVGYVAGNAMSNAHEYTRGNATVVLTTGFYGSTTLGLLSEPLFENVDFGKSTGQVVVGIALAGNIGGLALGHIVTDGRRLSTSQGNMVLTGTSAGALIGLGLGFLLGGDSVSSGAVFTMPIALGTAGFWLSWKLFTNSDEGFGDNIDFHCNPAALIAAVRAPYGTATGIGAPTYPASSIALVALRW